MSVFRYKGSKVWTMDFVFHAQRIRESTGTPSKTLAQKIEAKRRRELEEGTAGVKKHERPQVFSFAADDWLESKKTSLAPRSVVIERFNLSHLKPTFGKKLVVDIEASDISRYQKKRLAEGASARTVNIEVGTLRAILRSYDAWARLQKQVKMIPLGEEIGRAISAAEERALLTACGKSRSRSLFPLVVLAIETGARFNTLRMLQWGNVDFAERSLRFGKDKTKAGTGRVVPLNQRSIGTLTFWANTFPERKPTDYLFPSELYGLSGEEGYLNGRSGPYSVDVTKPMGSWKTAWNTARKLAGTILTGDPLKADSPPLNCRFHDLRHTSISRLINAGVAITKVAKLVGWQPSTMVAMAGKYGHHGLEDLRSAVETVSRSGNKEIDAGSPVFSPVSPVADSERVQ
jgi:integrase